MMSFRAGVHHMNYFESLSIIFQYICLINSLSFVIQFQMNRIELGFSLACHDSCGFGAT